MEESSTGSTGGDNSSDGLSILEVMCLFFGLVFAGILFHIGSICCVVVCHRRSKRIQQQQQRNATTTTTVTTPAEIDYSDTDDNEQSTRIISTNSEKS